MPNIVAVSRLRKLIVDEWLLCALGERPRRHTETTDDLEATLERLVDPKHSIAAGAA